MIVATRLRHLPTPWLSIAGRRIASWRMCAGVGILAGAVIVLLAMRAQGDGDGSALIVIATNLVAFAVFYRASWRLFSRVRVVLLEYLLLTLLATAGVMAVIGVPILSGLDAWMLGMGLGLACGRLGCLLAGCCHGRPAAWGVHYPWLRWPGAPRSMQNLLLIPVQAYEALILVAIFVANLLRFLSPHFPGDIVVFFLCAYSVARFGLELLRGDSRPYWRGLSEPQWTTLGLLLVIVALSMVDARSGEEARARLWLTWGCLALGMVIIVTVLLGKRREQPLLRPLHQVDVLELMQAVRTMRSSALASLMNQAADSVVTTSETARGIRIELRVADRQAPVEVYRLLGVRSQLDAGTAHYAAHLVCEVAGVDARAGMFKAVSAGAYALSLPPSNRERERPSHIRYRRNRTVGANGRNRRHEQAVR